MLIDKAGAQKGPHVLLTRDILNENTVSFECFAVRCFVIKFFNEFSIIITGIDSDRVYTQKTNFITWKVSMS